jgi:hypothetical protein
MYFSKLGDSGVREGKPIGTASDTGFRVPPSMSVFSNLDKFVFERDVFQLGVLG